MRLPHEGSEILEELLCRRRDPMHRRVERALGIEGCERPLSVAAVKERRQFQDVFLAIDQSWRDDGAEGDRRSRLRLEEGDARREVREQRVGGAEERGCVRHLTERRGGSFHVHEELVHKILVDQRAQRLRLAGVRVDDRAHPFRLAVAQQFCERLALEERLAAGEERFRARGSVDRCLEIARLYRLACAELDDFGGVAVPAFVVAAREPDDEPRVVCCGLVDVRLHHGRK